MGPGFSPGKLRGIGCRRVLAQALRLIRRPLPHGGRDQLMAGYRHRLGGRPSVDETVLGPLSPGPSALRRAPWGKPGRAYWPAEAVCERLVRSGA